MGYFSNNKDVNFEILKNNKKYIEALREKDIDIERLLDVLQNESDKVLSKHLSELLSEDIKKSIDIMVPLLYAVKNDRGTYVVYKCYNENLQNDIELAREIIENEPELIEDTPISNNRQFILEVATIKPEVVQHMSQRLKDDSTFTEELCELQNKEVTKYVAKECKMPDTIIENPNLANNKEFMIEAVKEDAKVLEHTPDQLKNNYEFIKETSRKNYEIVEHVVEHIEEYKLEAIKGARDTTREISLDNCISIINEMAEKSDDERYKKVKNKIKEKGIDDVRAMRWVTAMVAQDDNVSPEMLKKVLDYSILTMSKTKKDLNEQGKEKVSIDNIQEMITPQILNKLKEKALQQEIEIDADLDKKLEEYTGFYNNYSQSFKEEKAKQIKSKDKYNNKDTEKVTETASLEGVKEEIRVISEEIKKEREEVVNDKSNYERT